MADRRDVRIDDDDKMALGPQVIIWGKYPKTAITGAVYVHKELLVSNSLFCKEKLAEPESSAVRVLDQQVQHIERYVQYLYTGKLRARLKPACTHRHGIADAFCERCVEGNDNKDYETLIRLYLLGEKLKDDKFCDAVIDAIMATSEKVDEFGDRVLPSATLVNLVYKETGISSKLRRVLVDIFVCAANEAPALAPHLFLKDLSNTLLKMLKRPEGFVWPENLSSCNYHKHKEGEECKSKKRKRADEDGED